MQIMSDCQVYTFTMGRFRYLRRFQYNRLPVKPRFVCSCERECLILVFGLEVTSFCGQCARRLQVMSFESVDSAHAQTSFAYPSRDQSKHFDWLYSLNGQVVRCNPPKRFKDWYTRLLARGIPINILVWGGG